METRKAPGKMCFGLLRRHEILVPTLRGWFVLLVVCGGLIIAAAREIHPFLATTEPVFGGDLVVEGWMSDYALEKAIAEFRRNRYGRLYVTGGPIEHGASLTSHKTYAELGAAILLSKGMPASVVQAIPAPRVARDRTYSSAVALKRWLLENGVIPGSYHVISIGPHARRTRLLFERALGEGAVVGITAIEDRSYDPKRWWISSAGVRTVIGETIAYGYARFLF